MEEMNTKPEVDNFDPQVNSLQNQETPQPPQQPQDEPMPLKPDNHLALAIITTICCCLPFGIVAIIKASGVNSLYLAKQYAAAQKASDEAKKWSLIGIAAGVVIFILYGVFYGSAALMSLHH